MTKITFYNGLREIGGTFVEVETDQAKCMFDFGFAVSGRLDSKIKISKTEFAKQYLKLNMLTPADGIFDKEVADELSLKAFGEIGRECFFVISHMHIDHMAGLSCLSEQVPVYMSMDSYKLYNAMGKTGELENGYHSNTIGVDYDDEFCIGDITVKVLRLDHDVVGACGFLITTPDGTICYTGDYRFHGYHPEYTREFAKKAYHSDILITEGVTLSFDDVDILSLTEPDEEIFTEYTLLNDVKEYIQGDDGLVVVNPYNRNVERIHNLIALCNENDRKLLLDPICASYVRAFYPEDELYTYDYLVAESDYQDEEFVSSINIVSQGEVLANPNKYVLQLDYKYMLALLDLNDVVTKYVHMDGAPLGAYDPSFEKMKVFLESLGIEYNFKGTGGHAKPYFVKWMIDNIKPNTLVPLHSFRPEQVNSTECKERILPRYGQSYLLENGRMIGFGR